MAHFPSRIALSQAKVHRPPQGGICGSGKDGAESIVLSGGYVDDVDNGEELTYTGAGGFEKGTQVRDQTITNTGNAALNTSISTGIPIRVVRGYTLPSIYAPQTGYRYDGLYRVTTMWKEKRNKFVVLRFHLERVENQPPIPALAEVQTKKTFKLKKEPVRSPYFSNGKKTTVTVSAPTTSNEPPPSPPRPSPSPQDTPSPEPPPPPKNLPTKPPLPTRMPQLPPTTSKTSRPLQQTRAPQLHPSQHQTAPPSFPPPYKTQALSPYPPPYRTKPLPPQPPPYKTQPLPPYPAPYRPQAQPPHYHQSHSLPSRSIRDNLKRRGSEQQVPAKYQKMRPLSSMELALLEQRRIINSLPSIKKPSTATIAEPTQRPHIS
uniref:YDG domain-containing protein n=1 Tax=Arcella intermedia TaxID=1963864 RepID=A0A6B2L6V3_9EUKA